MVEDDLAPAGGRLRHAHRPFEQEGKSAAGLAGTEEDAPLWRLDQLGLAQEPLEELRGEARENREASE
jgi:hypothetical protein